MKTIKFLHISDLHLGVRSYRKISPITGEDIRLKDFENNLFYILNVGISNNIDFVIFSGDTFSVPYPTPNIQDIVYRAINLMLRNNISPIFLLGNHEIPSGYKNIHTFVPLKSLEIPGVKVFDTIEKYNLNTKNGEVQLIAIPYPTKNYLFSKYPELNEQPIEKLIKDGYKYFIDEIKELCKDIDKDKPAILLAHILISDAIISGWNREYIVGEEFIFPRNSLLDLPFQYGALGHIHRFQNLSPDGYYPLIYAGSIDRITFSEEKEDKGAVLVSLINNENKWHCEYEFVKSNPRKFLSFEFDIRDKKSPMDEINNTLKNANIDEAIVRLKIIYRYGEEKGIDRKAIANLMQDSFYYRIDYAPDEPLRKTNKIDFNWSNPISALSRYIDNIPDLKIQKDELINLVNEIMNEGQI